MHEHENQEREESCYIDKVPALEIVCEALVAHLNELYSEEEELREVANDVTSFCDV